MSANIENANATNVTEKDQTAPDKKPVAEEKKVEEPFAAPIETTEEEPKNDETEGKKEKAADVNEKGDASGTEAAKENEGEVYHCPP